MTSKWEDPKYVEDLAKAVRESWLVNGDVVHIERARPRWWNLLGWARWVLRRRGTHRVTSVSTTTMDLQPVREPMTVSEGAFYLFLFFLVSGVIACLL